MNPQLKAAIQELMRDFHVKADTGFDDALATAINTLANPGIKSKYHIRKNAS